MTARPTHRLTTWTGPAAPPATRDLVVVDREARTLDGSPVAVLGADREWYWLDGAPPARWGIRGLPGRRARSDVPATVDLTVRLLDRRVTLHLTEDEIAQLRGAARETELAEWIRSVVGRRDLEPAAIRTLLLERALQ